LKSYTNKARSCRISCTIIGSIKNLDFPEPGEPNINTPLRGLMILIQLFLVRP